MDGWINEWMDWSTISKCLSYHHNVTLSSSRIYTIPLYYTILSCIIWCADTGKSMGCDQMNRYISQLRTRFHDIIATPSQNGSYSNNSNSSNSSNSSSRTSSDSKSTNSSSSSSSSSSTIIDESSSPSSSSSPPPPLISMEDLHDAMLSLLLSEAQGHVRLLTVRMSDLLLTLPTELPKLGEVILLQCIA